MGACRSRFTVQNQRFRWFYWVLLQTAVDPLQTQRHAGHYCGSGRVSVQVDQVMNEVPGRLAGLWSRLLPLWEMQELMNVKLAGSVSGDDVDLNLRLIRIPHHASLDINLLSLHLSHAGC